MDLAAHSREQRFAPSAKSSARSKRSPAPALGIDPSKSPDLFKILKSLEKETKRKRPSGLGKDPRTQGVQHIWGFIHHAHRHTKKTCPQHLGLSRQPPGNHVAFKLCKKVECLLDFLRPYFLFPFLHLLHLFTQKKQKHRSPDTTGHPGGPSVRHALCEATGADGLRQGLVGRVQGGDLGSASGKVSFQKHLVRGFFYQKMVKGKSLLQKTVEIHGNSRLLLCKGPKKLKKISRLGTAC